MTKYIIKDYFLNETEGVATPEPRKEEPYLGGLDETIPIHRGPHICKY